MIRVLYVVSTLKNTGPVSQLLGIIRGLPRQAFTPLILTLSPEPTDSKKAVFEEQDIIVKSLNLNRIEYFLYGKRKALNVISELKPDIIHTSGVRADKLVTSLKIGIPSCSTIRSYIYEDYLRTFGRIKGKILIQLHQTAILKMRYPICCSETLCLEYSQLFSKQFYAIQNGIDIEKFFPLNDLNKKKLLRNSLRLPENQTLCLVSGNLIQIKDPLTIISAFNQLNCLERAMLIFLGEGELKKECQRLADSRVIFKGHVSNVERYLQAADIYISASFSEGLPNSVLEAGACGLSMILSDIPQHREIFPYQQGVCFFQPGSVHELKMHLETAINRYNGINKDISGYVRSNFSSMEMSKKYQDIYHTAALKFCKDDSLKAEVN